MPRGEMTRRQFAGFMVGFAFAATQARGATGALGLDHFKLRVSDLDKSVAFYQNLFGGRTVEIQGGSHLTPPGMRAIFLEIGSGETAMVFSPADSKVPVGLEHVSLGSFGMAVAARNNLPLAFPQEPYVFDPSGNLVEFADKGLWETPGPYMKKWQLQPGVVNQHRAFEPLAIRRVSIRVSDMDRAADFYKIFGAEVPGSASLVRREFDFRGTALELVSAGSPGLDGFSIAVRNFNRAAVRPSLRKLGIDAINHEANKSVAFRDPDGNRVELS